MAKRKKRAKKPAVKFSRKMRGKLAFLFTAMLVLVCGLIGRLMYINYTSSDKYKKIVLSQQSYDSSIIPFQRGDIVDTKGTVLATSVAVYNVILDCSIMTSDTKYIEPTIDALMECFPDIMNRDQLEDYAANSKDSRYIVLAKKLPYDQIQPFVEKQDDTDNHPDIKGVWFEKEYQREYPYHTLASSLIGFTASGNVGNSGLENYYNDTLNGINGREYGYLNSDNDFEKTVIDAKDGNTLVTTIDANIQSIVEEKIKEYNDMYTDNSREGAGSTNTGVLVMNPNNGEILAMANYPNFDLDNPRDLTPYYSQEQIDAMSDDENMDALNKLWQNYCITSTFEPGSVQKPFTIATGLDTGTVTDDMTFDCDGGEMFDGRIIGCVKRSGHGLETVRQALMNSCNDALMQMSYKIGVDNFVKYQSAYGFGLKTNIDLPGEANTSTLVYTLDSMKPVDLATNSFGQNYNTTMIQLGSAFCSLVNGGTYYQPHVVRKITDADGNTISTIDPTVVKETISSSTSDQIKDYMYSVVSEGTGKMAKLDGYSMGGKTGTAEKLPRGNGNYVVSFIGYVPQENPQLVIYVVVDEPNVENQSHGAFAMNISREILKEVLPYLNIYPDEEQNGTNAEYGILGTDVTKKSAEAAAAAGQEAQNAEVPQDENAGQ